MNDSKAPARRTWWSRPPPTFVPPLYLTAAAMLAFGYMFTLLLDLARTRAGTDFGEYLAAARLGMRLGWAAPYQRDLFTAELRTLDLPPDAWDSTPMASWLVVPFSTLPVHAGYLAWLALLAAVLISTWAAAAPGSAGLRRWHLVAALGVYPVYYALRLGQLTVIIVGLFVLHWWLLRRGRPLLAGVALGLACLKPQMVALVPFALLLSGHRKAAGACAVTVAGLAALALAAIGPAGLPAYRSSLEWEMTHGFVTRHTLSGQLPAWVPVFGLRAVIAVAALLPALLEGAQRYERAVVAAVLGSLLITPFLNAQDLALLVPCGWLLLRSEGTAWMRLPMMATWAILALEPWIDLPGTALILLAAEAGWLAALFGQAIQPAVLTAPAVRPAPAT